MKRTRAQQRKLEDPQDPAAAANPGKPQRRSAKQPRQPKAGASKKPAAATTARSAAAAAAAANAASAAASAGPEVAPTVPDVFAAAHGEAGARTVDCWDLDAGLEAAAWCTFGVEEEEEEEELLAWFEEHIKCNTSTSTPSVQEIPQAPSAPSPSAPPLQAPPAQLPSLPSGPITRARARELNYIILLKNEDPEA